MNFVFTLALHFSLLIVDFHSWVLVALVFCTDKASSVCEYHGICMQSAFSQFSSRDAVISSHRALEETETSIIHSPTPCSLAWLLEVSILLDVVKSTPLIVPFRFHFSSTSLRLQDSPLLIDLAYIYIYIPSDLTLPVCITGEDGGRAETCLRATCRTSSQESRYLSSWLLVLCPFQTITLATPVTWSTTNSRPAGDSTDLSSLPILASSP